MVQASNLSPAFTGDGNQLSLNSRLSTHLLDARDLELLGHYLSHTSRSIAYDRDDLYALHVGIPNLAFTSKALMSSMLALAAACQCHDLLEEAAPPPPPPQRRPGAGLSPGPDMPRIRELMVLAEQHHAASLRQIQEDIPSTERYDHVLANAALMVLYGSASHWVRIRLVRMCEAGDVSQLPEEFVPVQSQWISLIRAVNSAYVGLLADEDRNPGGAGSGDCERSSPPRVDFGDVNIPCPQGGPSDETRRLFLPILAATSGPALLKVRARARQVEREAGAHNASFQACKEALAVFETILSETFRDEKHTGFSPETPGSQLDDKKEPVFPHSLAPWLRHYTARVTMNSTDMQPLRRTVNAFVNRVPTTYLHMVQATLEHIPVQKSQQITPETGDTGDGPVNRLAMDIFAHWLVLVLLLDGVWWIGGIGAWELGRVVGYVREGGRFGRGDEEESEAWWPESMYNIRLELSRHLTE